MPVVAPRNDRAKPIPNLERRPQNLERTVVIFIEGHTWFWSRFFQRKCKSFAARSSAIWGAHAPRVLIAAPPPQSSNPKVRDGEGAIASTRGACAPREGRAPILDAAARRPYLWEAEDRWLSRYATQ